MIHATFRLTRCIFWEYFQSLFCVSFCHSQGCAAPRQKNLLGLFVRVKIDVCVCVCLWLRVCVYVVFTFMVWICRVISCLLKTCMTSRKSPRQAQTNAPSSLREIPLLFHLLPRTHLQKRLLYLCKFFWFSGGFFSNNAVFHLPSLVLPLPFFPVSCSTGVLKETCQKKHSIRLRAIFFSSYFCRHRYPFCVLSSSK